MNRPWFYTAIFSLLTILIIPALEAYAAPEELPADVVQSIVLLRSKSNNSCATGFITVDGLLATNSHVTRAICSSGSCADLEVWRAAKIGERASEKVSFTEASIFKDLSALDVSFLQLKTPAPLKGVFRTIESPVVGAGVTTLGFPNCSILSRSTGKIDRVDSLRLASSTEGAHGSSGSPLFTENFRLVGIIGESDTIWGGFVSMLSNYRFKTIGIRADNAFEFLQASEDTMLERQAALLLANYRENVRTLTGLNRVRAAISFSGAVEGLADSFLFLPGKEKEVQVLAGLGHYLEYLPRVTPPPANSPLLQTLSSLVLAHNLEMKGLYGQFLKPVSIKALFDGIDRSTAPASVKDDWKELITFAVRQGYQGLDLYGMILGVRVVALVLLFALGLGWSAGYVFAGIRGSFVVRLAWAASNFLVWPIPVLKTWWQRRKAANS
jgi:hypothetical protein